MKADLKFKAVWWNSFLFYWALIFLLFALVAAAADFFNLGRLMLWAALSQGQKRCVCWRCVF